jgi:two-component system chemotaxis response regulator CheB
MMCKLVIIGSSLGGLRALQKLLPLLIDSSSIPVILVQHRDADIHTGDMLSQMLQRSSHAQLKEAEDRMPIELNHIYLAPADYHLMVEESRIVLSTEMPVAHARPSIDVAFESAARFYGASVAGVILTGTGNDGAAGLAQIERRGGIAIIQDPQTAEQSAMPLAALAATRTAKVLALEEIGAFLSSLDQRNFPQGTRERQ